MMTSPLPLKAEKLLRSELNTSEQLLWSGQPLANRSIWGSLPLVLFGIPWTAFSVYWVIMATGMARDFASDGLLPLVFPLFGTPFVLAGLWLLSSPYWMRRKAQTTVYALTDKRALILSPTWRGEVAVRSIPPEHLTDRTRTQNADSYGSLFFTRVTVTQRRAGPDGGTYEVPIGFENIADVRAVEALIERTYHTSE